ncbi:Protein of unknown function [Streptoalloteichus hindustanus]|uniref:Uncharacterized protein n=1 Tax=Streptoalloteichus hindustanus TaxID=2017 RepID=A0A1M5NSK5_STRHI|nr:Protein of unknown function [Streptoalloteichus hindustanus]
MELSPTASYVSEHSAAKQPYRWFFRLPDVLAGVLLLVAAGVLSVLTGGRVGAALVFGVAFLGGTTAGIAVFPLDCALSRDQLCRAAEEAGELSTAHTVHQVLSVLAFLASVIAAFAAQHLTTGRARTALRAVLSVLLVTGALAVPLQETDWAGLAQRVQLAAVAVGLAVGAGECFATGARARGDQPSREGEGRTVPDR